VTAPDRWFVLTARAPADDLATLLSEGLLALGGLSVVEEGDGLTTYLPPPEDTDRFIREAYRFLADWLMEDVAPDLAWRWQDNEDWEREWKRGLAPRKVSPRIVVKPTWTEWQAAPGEVVIEVDPEMAFGTGEHATTRSCLQLLDGAIRGGDRVLDVGAGSAILSIAAARLGASEVVAIEYDADANLNARDNLARNGVQQEVCAIEAMADAPLLRDLGTFDLILANILSGVIRPLLPAFHESLRSAPGGRLIVSGILQSEDASVVRDAETAGFRVVETVEEEEWWTALLVPGEA
jgi:ribosomal protein L11 methyltransferase